MDNNDCRWPVAIGTTESGEERVFDYSKASNILVAGAPKQGKSTAIGTIVDAIKSCPEASGIKFFSIDTTKPHWVADETLGSLCRELERREDLRNVGVDISGFPLIVTVIDEYSDLVEFGSQDSRRSVKDSILRLAKEGPGLGIRLILSSRHPAKEVKALLDYFPTRMVLRVSDRKDSKLLLKSEAAFWDLNSSGEMFLYDKGVISHCSLSGVTH
ncbi:MAG: FtsK/SpoIIIE domain-containing protein [Bacteroidales bacterium]|nr:FtsK/SpoIIIE domain-containing protein [Bacteroidales bacterium]